MTFFWQNPRGALQPNCVPCALQANQPLGVDEAAADELLLYLDKDRRFSPQSPEGRGRSVVMNLLRKMKRGTYDHARAPQAWQYVVDDAAKAYQKEFGGPRFDATTRRYVAHELANEFLAAVERGEYAHLQR